ncbi:MAG: NAD(P)-binding protein [bacterium]|nr:NAD(P)-binding protein [bacterium]
MSNTQDAVIIGAGVIGCSIAYRLGRKGIRSRIIERESVGCDEIRATYFGGMGICLSPGTGQIMAGLISTGEVPFRAKQLMKLLGPAQV